MQLTIIGTESLGVRGLSCLVKVPDRVFMIDPGLALGFVRYRHLPHPIQIAVGQIIRQRILDALPAATDLIISHFHGDHIPLMHANPYQISIQQIPSVPVRIWAHPYEAAPDFLQQRETALVLGLKHSLRRAEGVVDETLSFSAPVPHGQSLSDHDTVTMTIIDDGAERLIHASDIQLLHDETVTEIIRRQPDIVIASGPPLYRIPTGDPLRRRAWLNMRRLADQVPTLILDHHLLRSDEGFDWLAALSRAAGHPVFCAADFMKFPRHPLEAMRAELYDAFPVPDQWHELYDRTQPDLSSYLQLARQRYPWFAY